MASKTSSYVSDMEFDSEHETDQKEHEDFSKFNLKSKDHKNCQIAFRSPIPDICSNPKCMTRSKTYTNKKGRRIVAGNCKVYEEHNYQYCSDCYDKYCEKKGWSNKLLPCGNHAIRKLFPDEDCKEIAMEITSQNIREKLKLDPANHNFSTFRKPKGGYIYHHDHECDSYDTKSCNPILIKEKDRQISKVKKANKLSHDGSKSKRKFKPQEPSSYPKTKRTRKSRKEDEDDDYGETPRISPKKIPQTSLASKHISNAIIKQEQPNIAIPSIVIDDYDEKIRELQQQLMREEIFQSEKRAEIIKSQMGAYKSKKQQIIIDEDY